MGETEVTENIDDSIYEETPRELAPSSSPLGGRPANIDPKVLLAYQAKPLANKGETLRNLWADVAYTVLLQAERFSRSVTKKDYGRLVQLLSSAGIAYDKVVPKGDTLRTNLTFNLFNGLPQARVLRVLGDGDNNASRG